VTHTTDDAPALPGEKIGAEAIPLRRDTARGLVLLAVTLIRAAAILLILLPPALLAFWLIG
jgi:hypothetical protein